MIHQLFYFLIQISYIDFELIIIQIDFIELET